MGQLGGWDPRMGGLGRQELGCFAGIGFSLSLCLVLLEVAWSLGEEHSTPVVELWALKTG